MSFLEPTLESFQKHVSKLKDDTPPLWGSMSAQKMVEHLSDWIDLVMTTGEQFELLIPEEKVPKAQAFLFSEYSLPREFKVKFLPPELDLRNDNVQGAIEEFESKWTKMEAFYEANPDHITLHPNFGRLDHKHVLALHSKHLTHHFQQFGLVPS